MELIDIKIYIGNNADVVSNGLLPTGVSAFDPYIKWQLPPQIQQVRFAIKITNVENPQLVWIYKGVTSQKQLQIPLNNGFNSKWLGLCFVQIQVSQILQYKVGSQFQYTSGQMDDNPNGYFVLDPNTQVLSMDNDIQYYWSKSIDQNVQQNLIYQLQVATHPLFRDLDLILNQTQISGDTSGYVSFVGNELSQGFYFFRVRAFDGYDWSQWSVVNVFKVRRFSLPTLQNLTYEITNNQFGDVIIQFDSNSEQQDYVSVILTYCPIDNLSLQYPCTLTQTSHIVPNGHNRLIWRSSEDIKVDASFYFYAFAYCNGMYSETIIQTINLQNYKYSIVNTTVSNTKVNFNVCFSLAPVLKKVYYNYIGWKTNVYSYDETEKLLANKKYDYASFFVTDILKQPRKQYSYIGWNSDIKQGNYQGSDRQVPSQKYKMQNTVFNKYVIHDYKDFCLYVDGRNFTVHNDDAYCITDQTNKENPNQSLSLTLSAGEDSKKVVVKPPLQKAPSYAPQYKGEMPAEGGEDRNGNPIQISPKINFVYADPNLDWNVKVWVDAKKGQQGQDNGKRILYLKVWGGSIQGDGGSGGGSSGGSGGSGGKQGTDENLQMILQQGQTRQVYEQYDKKIGAYTLPDGKVQFEDNKEAAQYTMYPNAYDATGYPTKIDDDKRQNYWQSVKLEELYIKKYKIQKGGADPGGIYYIDDKQLVNEGYKNFSVKKREGYFHRYYSNKKIPLYLFGKDKLYDQNNKQTDIYNKLCDQSGKQCYVYNKQLKLFQLVTKLYLDLPQQIKYDSDKNNLVFDSFYFDSKQKKLKQYQQGLYFQQYVRLYNYSRGKAPQIADQCWNCQGSGLVGTSVCDICCGTVIDENGKQRGNGKTVIDKETNKVKQIKQPPFANVAVPYYVPAKNAVYSINGYNGRKSAFDLGFKIKRDKRRYVLGHYYKWEKRQTNQARLAVLNKYITDFYSDIDFSLPQFDSIIIHYKYKYLGGDSVDQIKQDNYIYVPVYIEDDNSLGGYICKRAWFIDSSLNTFSSIKVNGNKFNWDGIDGGDYICIYRDFNGFNGKFSSFPHKIRQRNLIQQGTKHSFSLIKKKNYYSDKSKYGVQSYDVVGSLSDVVTQSFSKISNNQYSLINRVIRLNHKDVDEDSIQVYYFNGVEKNQITKFKYKPANLYYNASVEIEQNSDYIDKQIYIDYRYYQYQDYKIDRIKSDVINFTNYNQEIYFDSPYIDVDSLVLTNQSGQILSKNFYLFEQQKNIIGVDNNGDYKYEYLQMYKLKLIPYYNNKELFAQYEYRQYSPIEPIVYNIGSDENIELINEQYYAINNLNLDDIVPNSVKISCLYTSGRNHLIDKKYYSIYNNVFTVDFKQQYLQKPTLIRYKYNLLKNNAFKIIFTGFKTYLSRMYVDVSTIKIYYTLQNGVDRNITNYFNIYAGDQKILYYGYPTISGQLEQQDENNPYKGQYSYNVSIELATYDKQRLEQVFGNSLNVRYNDSVQEKVYLSLPSIVDSRFEDGFNYQVYFDKDKREQVANSLYFISHNQISLKTKSDYTQVIPYLNKPMYVFYQKKDEFVNQFSCENYSFVITQLNSAKVIQANGNIVQESFHLYVFNQYYGLDQLIRNDGKLQQYDYSLDSKQGTISLQNSDYLNKKLIASYQYQQKLMNNKTVTHVFNYIGQQFSFAKADNMSTVYAYVDANKYKQQIGNGEYEITMDNHIISLKSQQVNQLAKLICVYISGETNGLSMEANSTIDEIYYTYKYNETGEGQIIFGEKCYGWTVAVSYIKKLPTDCYSIEKFKAIANSSEIISDPRGTSGAIVVNFVCSYVEKTILHSKYNNILNNDNNTLQITQQQIDNRIKKDWQFVQDGVVIQQDSVGESSSSGESDYTGYVSTYVDVNTDIIQWEIYYQYDLVENIPYEYDNDKIVVLRDVNTIDIDSYLKIQYDQFSDTYLSSTTTVQFSNSFAQIALKPYSQIVSLTYTDEQNKNYDVCEGDYQLPFDNNGALKLTNRFIGANLTATYTKTVYNQQSAVTVCGSKDDGFTLFTQPFPSQVTYYGYNIGKDVLQSSVIVYCERNKDDKYQITGDQYSIISKLEGYYIVMDSVVYYHYKDKKLTFTWKTIKKEEVSDNKHIEYLMFKSGKNSIYFDHVDIYSHILKYYVNELLSDGKTYSNSWQIVPDNSYTFKNGDSSSESISNASISIIETASNVKFFRKKLLLQYYVQKQSDVQTVSFKNDRSLVFPDENGHVILSNTYIDENSLVVQYQGDNGVSVMPPEAYQVDIGNEQHYAVIVLNKDYDGYQQYINKRLVVQYRYIKDPKIVYRPQNQKFPYLDYIFNSNINSFLDYYYQGYPISQHQAYYYRNQPTYIQGRGIRLVTNIKEPSVYNQLKFVYLQSFWDAYNTIHMQGTMDNNTRIVLQYGQVDNIGYVDQKTFKDFITKKSEYSAQINSYLLQPLTYDVFVDTFDESIFKQKQNYILRMRLYNITSSYFTSQWIYSSVFQIDHEAVNPVNILDISYNPWTRKCTIQFRIDDTDGDLYDLIGYAYTSDGRVWTTIDPSNITGNTLHLVSNKRNADPIITHRIIWDTSIYQLTASSTYRIRINATYTKYNQGDEAMFLWQTSLNPKIDYYQAKLFSLNGGKQYYKQVTQKTKTIQNSDGTVSYQQLEQPLVYWTKIPEYTYTFLDSDGNPLKDENGKIITQQRNYAIVDGKLQQNYKKIQQIKSRPYKTVFENGQVKEIPWGYLQYCNSNGNVVDYDGYTKWLAQTDSEYKVPRQTILNQLQRQNKQILKDIQQYKEKILVCQMQNRRKLIKQGFYSNGFLYNQYNVYDSEGKEEGPAVFTFRLKGKPATEKQLNWLKANTQYGMYQFKYNFQLDFLDTYDSQFNHRPLRDIYTYKIGDIVLNITAGVNKDDINSSSLYKGNFTLNKQNLPGKYITDVNNVTNNPSDYSYDYYWRIRPYAQFKDKKRQICRTNIISVKQDNKNVIIQFEVTAQKDAGVLTTSVYRDYYYGDKYKLYYQKKKEDDSINLIQPFAKITPNKQYFNLEDIGDCTVIKHVNQNNVRFVTDRLVETVETVNGDKKERFLEAKQPFLNWISFTTNRQRPHVLIFNNQYYMFYDKKGLSNSNLLYMAVSKNGSQFGQYSQVYPYVPTANLSDVKFIDSDGYQTTINNFTNPYAVRDKDGFLVFAKAIFKRFDNVQSRNIVCLKSDYSADNFEQPILCHGQSHPANPWHKIGCSKLSAL